MKLHSLVLFIFFVCCTEKMLPMCTAFSGHTFFSPRSQSVHADQTLVGWEQYINVSMNRRYDTQMSMLLLSRTFDPQRIARYFFATNALNFSGSFVSARGANDILADYFGLPLDYQSSVIFKPYVSTELFNFNWYAGFDDCVPGLYMRFQVPLVHTRWSMALCEQILNTGTQEYPAGYMASDAVDRSALYADVGEAFTGSKAVGDIQPLKYGKINGSKSRTGLSEIQFIVGYNPLLDVTYHGGFNVRLSVPTGNQSHAEYLFEPIFGNGHHWELGGGLTGHAMLWGNEHGTQFLRLYSDLNITHLFKSYQRRSFDLKNGLLSRYMLIQQMHAPLVAGLDLDTVAATQQYTGTLMPAINQTTLDAQISIAAQIDGVIKLAYQHNNIEIDLGYDIWWRSAEKLCWRDVFPSNAFALKGDAQVYGFVETQINQFVAINATESNATINGGQGTGNVINVYNNLTNNFTNRNADNAAFIEFKGDALAVSGSSSIIVNINGSNQAVLLTDCAINDASGLAPAVLSHTLFCALNYGWNQHCGSIPFINTGVSVEFDGTSKKICAALSNWSIWIKGGVCW